MNKREFVAGSVGAVVGGTALAATGPATPMDTSRGSLARLLERTQRLPDLVERPGAAAFDAYVGERFTIVGGAANGTALTLQSVRRVARCSATEQFDVSFAATHADGAVPRTGLRLLEHATGQRLVLNLEGQPEGYVARFNLLA